MVLTALAVVGAICALAFVNAAASGPDAADDPSATTTGPGTTPATSAPEHSGAGETFTVYAHSPLDYRSSSPADYVAALQQRSSWADGLFLYYPVRLDFGARPEIDALQAAYPDGVPLTISAKSASPEGLAAFRDQLTPQQAAVTLWERWQEPADDFTTTTERATYRDLVEQDISILRPAGIRVGVHEQCWTLDPENHQSWSGAGPLAELIPPDVDIVTATCIGGPTTNGAPEMQRFLDFMTAKYPGVDIGFTSLAWSVPAGTPADSPLRAQRASAAQDAFHFAAAAGVTEFGWFDFADWEGRDYDVESDPALLSVLTDVSARTVG